MSDFQHRHLDLKSSAFRLLRLFRGCEDDSIECELIHTTLDENVIPYEAVSYTWGELSNPFSIRIEDRNYQVTSNVRHLLYDLRDANEDRYLWIDAVCIDQNNPSERGHQVQHMGAIYRGAERVLIWLEIMTIETEIFMDSMCILQEQLSGRRLAPDDPRWMLAWEVAQGRCLLRHGDYVDQIQRTGLRQILNHSWFCRVWVLQEVANARRALLCCGKRSIPTSILAMSPTLLEVKVDNHTLSIFELLPTYSKTLSRTLWNRSLPLILIKFYKSQASIPRDKIFALLGLCTDENVMKTIVPDYINKEKAIVRTVIDYIVSSDPISPPAWTLQVDLPGVDLFLSQLALTTQYSLSIHIELILGHMLSSWGIPEVQAFLGHSSGHLMVTPQLLTAAASNKHDGAQMVGLLLRRSKTSHAWINPDSRNNLRDHPTRMVFLGLYREMGPFDCLVFASIFILNDLLRIHETLSLWRKEPLLQFQRILAWALRVREHELSAAFVTRNKFLGGRFERLPTGRFRETPDGHFGLNRVGVRNIDEYTEYAEYAEYTMLRCGKSGKYPSKIERHTLTLVAATFGAYEIIKILLDIRSFAQEPLDPDWAHDILYLATLGHRELGIRNLYEHVKRPLAELDSKEEYGAPSIIKEAMLKLPGHGDNTDIGIGKFDCVAENVNNMLLLDIVLHDGLEDCEKTMEKILPELDYTYNPSPPEVVLEPEAVLENALGPQAG